MEHWEPPVRKGTPAATFFGQAGFVFTLADGTTVGVDLYLSDCCWRYFGFKRLMPYLVSPQALELDYLIATHAHYDHFDPDAVPLLMANGRTRLLCAQDVRPEAERLHLEAERIAYLSVGDRFEAGGLSVTAVPCDHGEEAPDAIGLLLAFDGRRVYITGDTAFRPDTFADPELQGTDMAILPINGAFGNMNEAQGAQAAALLGAKLTVPCHFWNFAEHGGDPARFCEAAQALGCAYRLLRPGETITL